MSVAFWYSLYHHWIQNTVSFTLKCRGYLIYPVRNNAPLEFLTGFTSDAIFSTIFNSVSERGSHRNK
jgi:hypothetical protein